MNADDVTAAKTAARLRTRANEALIWLDVRLLARARGALKRDGRRETAK